MQRTLNLSTDPSNIDPNLPAKPEFEQTTTNMVTTMPANTGLTAGIAKDSSGAYSQTVYTNPMIGISFTRQELFEYGQGRKTNAKGDVLFFKPSFVEDNPWSALLRNKK